jgi:serine/threonine protein kinase
MTDASHSPPPPADKARIEAVVAQCIEALEKGERDPATRLCADDRELLVLVQRRLAHLAARGLIPDSEMLPASIGPYRVLKELGSGGMGHVYLADQTTPVRRQVALKVIKLGMDTREVVARFQAERQALALMSHPNIAAVFDAGITREGRPYFVMEYVPGQMLTSFCDARTLPTEARVRLVATVCRAVQHAHDRGFIHRDLKPSNILVTAHEGEFVPKIIDFGVAKATAAAAEGDATKDASLRTRADQVLGTPEYMSPEQMSSGGLDVDTRTDVYSLGVTLYELLCGELPFDSRRLRSVGRNELERILRDELPTQPSKRLSHVDADVVAARGGQRSTVQRSVAGELDWITLKALAKQRDQRYPSALALAEDLERLLSGEPVVAAPPGRAYRLRKFVRRHRVAVGAAVTVLLSLVAGLVVSLYATNEAIAARQRESDALGDAKAFFALSRDAVNNLVDAANEQLADVPQAETVRRQLLTTAMTFYTALRQREPADVDLQLDRLTASQHIGELLQQLGKPIDALAALQQCKSDADAMRANHAPNSRLLAIAVGIENSLGAVCTALGRTAEARRAFDDALATLATVRQLDAAALPDADAVEGRLLANLAGEYDQDDVAKALGLFERAFAAFDRADAKLATVRRRARAAVAYATALTRVNRVADAATALADAVARVQAAPPSSSRAAREDEAFLHENLATVLRRLDRGDEARKAKLRAIELYGELAAEHPEVPGHADKVAAGWHFLAQLDESEAKLDDALREIGKAVEQRESLRVRFPQQYRLAMHCARSLLEQASIEVQLWQHQSGDVKAPRETLERAIAIADEVRKSHTDDFDVLLTFSGVHTAMGSLDAASRRYEDALAQHLALRDVLTEQLATFATNAELHYQLAVAGSNLFQAYYLLKRPEDALAAGEAGLDHCERGLALDARHVPLRELVPQLVGRIATARFGLDDAPGGVEALQTMCDSEAWGADAREQGCLLLGERLHNMSEGSERSEWLERLALSLRKAIEARGSLAEALRRPPQKAGMSHVRSRLRDFDLRATLADVAGELQQYDEQEKWLAEAQELAATLPEMREGRVRSLHAQRMELALAREKPLAAETAGDEFLARAGEHNGGNYLFAVLFARAAAIATAPADKERLATKAVDSLRRALADGEVPASAAKREHFEGLRGRADYESLAR